MYPHIIKSSSITILPPGQPPVIVTADSPAYNKVLDFIREDEWDAALAAASPKQVVARWASGGFEIDESGIATFNGRPVHNYVVDKIVEFAEADLPVDPLVKFMGNLLNNPAASAVNELYLFLEAAQLPITEDGHFLAYKAVTHNFRDKRTGKFDNTPGGPPVEMPRNEVDDNREQTCSSGLHAAAYNYARGFMEGADKLVVVKINPADVVSVPSDYDNEKLRCCRYTVVEEVVGASDVLKAKALA